MADSVNRSINIFFNEQELTASLERAQQKATTLEQRMKDIGDKSSPEFLKLQTQLNNTTKTIGDLSARIDGKLAPSLRQMEGQVRKTWNELQNIPVGTPEWNSKLKEFDKLNAHLIKTKAEVGAVGRAMTTFGDQFKTIALGVFVGNTIQSAVQTVQGYITGAISGAAKVSDELADIQKTTGLTNDEVRELNKELAKIDTRTSTSDLRQIAAVGGQFNVAKEDLAEFTAAVDKINVALGDEFGGGAENVAEQLAKLRNIFTDVKTQSIDKDLLNIGNALNALGNAGVATSDVVADFANRIAGVGIPLGLTTGQVLGISATLQELGVNAERGGTAVSKILQKMVVNVDEFAKVAGLSVSQFTKLLNQDLYKAFQLVVEGSGKAGASATAMANLLKDAELSGAGAAEVFLKLSGNTQLMGEKVALAGTALQNTDSIMQEFNSKNNNLAANLEKIEKRFASLFSGLGSAIEPLVKALADLVEREKDAVEQFNEQNAVVEKLNTSVVPLISRYDELKDKTNLNSTEQAELKDIIEKVGNAIPSAITQFDEYGRALDINTEKAREFVKQQQDFLKFKNSEAIASQQAQLDSYNSSIKGLVATLNKGYKDVEIGSTGTFKQVRLTNEEIKRFQEQIKKLSDQRGEVENVLKVLKGDTLNQTETPAEQPKATPAFGIEDDAAKKQREKELAEYEKLIADITKLRRELELATLNDDQREIERLRDKYKALEERAKGHFGALMQLRELYGQELEALVDKQFANRSEKEYTASLATAQAYYDKLKLLAKQQFATTGDEETYFRTIEELEFASLNTKKQIAEDYKDTSKKANEDVAKVDADIQNKIADSHIKTNKAIMDSDEARAKNAIQQAEKEKQERIRIAEEIAAIATTAIRGIFDLQAQFQDIDLARDRKKNDAKKTELDNLLQRELISREDYNNRLLALDEQYNQKAAKIKREQFVKEKAARIIEATIAGSLGVVKASPNIPLMVLAGIMAATQVALIAAAPVPEFGEGGKLKGPKHKSKSRGMNIVNNETGQVVARAEGDEWIVNDRSSAKYDGLLKAVNEDDGYAINKWFLNRPEVNLSGMVDLMKYRTTTTTQAESYNDAKLRRTIQEAQLYSSQYIVNGIVSGIASATYAQSRKL